MSFPAVLAAQHIAFVLCVTDASTGAPLVGATVRRSNASSSIVMRDACAPLRELRSGDTIDLTRSGFRSARVQLDQASDTVRVQLAPLTSSPVSARVHAKVHALDVQHVVADADRGVGLAVTQDVRDAQERGAGTAASLLALLPFTQLRTARGETGVSLRGARREQVVMTLDGMPLNDPATGLADVADIPLASLGSATVAPGSDPVGAGLGATGGVVALTTRAKELVTLRSGSFGQVQVEAAGTSDAAGARWNGAVGWRRARNDFPFVNAVGESPITEVRVNNDEAQLSLSGGVVHQRTQVTVLASTSERGMVGPANVRTYDHDRARTNRINARIQRSVASSVLSAGIRRFELAYRDPTRPVLDSRASAWAADLDWRGTLGPGTWRVGAGADRLQASGGLEQRRSRGFAAYGIDRSFAANDRGRLELGVRTDVVERLGAQPSGSAGVRWELMKVRGVRVGTLARVAQAVRVPTLYDLYFSNPQRLIVRALAPERVTLDGSTGLTAVAGSARRSFSTEVTAVTRTTRDAIVWFPGNFGWSPENVGREVLRGVETRSAFVYDALQIDGWLTDYDALLHSNGLRIPTPYVARLAGGTRVQHTLRVATISANTRYVGRRPYTAGPRDPFYELPAVWLVDGAVSHHRSVQRADVLVTLALDNATNAHWQSVRGFPMPGRNWSLGISLEPRRQR